jgi:hypothetical protein
MYDLRSSHRRLWLMPSSGMWRRVVLMCTVVSTSASTRSTRRHIPEDGILHYIILSQDICNVMLWRSGNFRKALVAHSVLDLDADESFVTLQYRSFLRAEIKPAYGTHVLDLGYLSTQMYPCLNMPIWNKGVVSCLTTPKLKNFERGSVAVTKPRETELTFPFPARKDENFISLEFTNLSI